MKTIRMILLIISLYPTLTMVNKQPRLVENPRVVSKLVVEYMHAFERQHWHVTRQLSQLLTIKRYN